MLKLDPSPGYYWQFYSARKIKSGICPWDQYDFHHIPFNNENSLAGWWQPQRACVQGNSLHQCLWVRGWHRGSESRNPLRGQGGGEPRGAVLARCSGAMHTCFCRSRGWLGSTVWEGDDVTWDWKMSCLWCQRRCQINSPRRYNPICISEISTIPLEEHNFLAFFVSSFLEINFNASCSIYLYLR